MASVDRKWLPPALIVAAGIASIVAYGKLPPMVVLRLEGLLPFETPQQPANAAPRWLVLSMLPVLALVLWAAFRWAATAAGQRVARRMFRNAPVEVTSPTQFDRFANTYDTIVFGVVFLPLGLHAAVLAAALHVNGAASRIVPIVLGVSLILMGNVMPRLRPNWVAGLRSQRILADPQLWRRTHRVFGAAFVVAGLATILTGVAAPQYALLVGIASVFVSCLIGLIVSRRTGNTASLGV
jgi:uncharacterized membrane protein